MSCTKPVISNHFTNAIKPTSRLKKSKYHVNIKVHLRRTHVGLSVRWLIKRISRLTSFFGLPGLNVSVDFKIDYCVSREQGPWNAFGEFRLAIFLNILEYCHLCTIDRMVSISKLLTDQWTEFNDKFAVLIDHFDNTQIYKPSLYFQV